MKTILSILGLTLALSTTASANQKLMGWCEDGNQTVTTSGLSSTTKVQRSYVSGTTGCTVTVYNAGTLTLSTIYSDNIGTSKANPFTAASSGQWFFYASSGRYDVKFSSGGILTPFTLGDYLAFDPFSASNCAVTQIFCNGGNSFGSTAILGTLDNQDLQLIRVGVVFATLQGVSTINRIFHINVKLTVSGDTDTTGGTLTGSSIRANSSLISLANTDLSGNLDTTNLTGNVVLGGSGGNATQSLAASTFIQTCTGTPSTPTTGSVTTFCKSTDNKMYYIDSGGTVTGPLGSGGGGGPFWNASTTAGGVNSAAVTTYIGTNMAGGNIGFVTGAGGTVRGIITAAGGWGINTITPGAVMDISDTTTGIPLRLTGKATGSSGVCQQYYETTTLSGQICSALGSSFAIATVGLTPITLNPGASPTFNIYATNSTNIAGQFTHAAEWVGIATGNQAVSGASNGRIIYDSTLNHFYVSENGGAYFQLNAGGGGTGWPIGSAANVGIYSGNNDGTTKYWDGLLTNNAWGLATNSIAALQVDISQNFQVGGISSSLGSGHSYREVVTGTSNGYALALTSTSVGTELDFYGSSTVLRGTILATNSNSGSLVLGTAAGFNMYLINSGHVLIGTNSDCIKSSWFCVSATNTNVAEFNTTQSEADIWLEADSNTTYGKITASSLALSMYAIGTQPIDFFTNTNQLAGLITSGQQWLINHSSAASPYTVMEIKGTGAGITSVKGNALLLDVAIGGAINLILSYNGGGQAYLGEFGGVNTTLHDGTQVTIEAGGNNLTIDSSGVKASTGLTSTVVVSGTCTLTVVGGIITSKTGC